MTAQLQRRLQKLSLLLIVIAMIRIAATLSVLSATTDEPVHVTAGVEILLQHRATIVIENPPLSRVLFAIPLVAAGVDFDVAHDAQEFIGRTFYSRGQYRTNLVLARAANLLFFAIAALAVWRIALREIGPLGGLVATLLFTMQPLVLGFAGIANHDIPATAGTALSLLTFLRWLERRTARRAVVLGFAYGLSIGLKLSCIAFVPAACVALFVVRAVADPELRRDWRAVLTAVPVILFASAFALWTSYGFYAGLFFRGLSSMIHMARSGFWGYAFGMWSNEGWWWYFPVALLLKLTLASLLIVICGFLFPSSEASDRNRFLQWLAAAGAILVIVLPSKIDLGVRYVLPMLVPFTIAMACAITAMLRRPQRSVRIAAMVLLVWHGGASLVAHPQYFAYFNLLAGRDPSRCLIDSNLDWGQDALLLKKVLRENRAESVGRALVGMHDYDGMGFPPSYPISPDIPATGWIAVSDHMYRIGRSRGGWRWLRDQPYERVGASIRLYNIPHT